MTDEEVAENYVACPTTGCWLWVGPIRGEYGSHSREIKGKQTVFWAHRTVLAMKLGREMGPGLQACHTCDRPLCIRPDHLWEGTQQENIADRVRKNRSARFTREQTTWYRFPELCRGEKNNNAKLSWAQVDEIRALAKTMNNCQLARKYGVTANAIRFIRIGRNWPERNRPVTP